MNTIKQSTPARLYSVRDVAEAWGMSERSIRRAIADGRLQCTRIGRSVRMSENQIAQFLEDGTEHE